RPRGLCWSCYYRPGVRDRFPSTSKFAHRGVDDFNGKAALAPVPTLALPGTADKVAVLEERARLRQALWHPQDALVPTDPRLAPAPLAASRSLRAASGA